MYDKQLCDYQGNSQSGRHELRGEVRGDHDCAAPRQEEKPDRSKARGDRKRVRVDVTISPRSRGENDFRRNFYKSENKGQTDPIPGENVRGTICKRVCIYGSEQSFLSDRNSGSYLEQKCTSVGVRSNVQHKGGRREQKVGSSVLPRNWKDWLRSFFRRMRASTKVSSMARWGRSFYGITEKDDKKAIKKLAIILMGMNKNCSYNHAHSCKNRNSLSRNKTNTSKVSSDGFYDSWEWKTLRYKVIKKYGARCMLCGRTPADGVKICVDHIKPRALFPELELDENNLQVLCNDCNMGKGRWDETDWRR